MIHSRDTYLALRAFVDELARCGLREACTSPGSRSTPLVLTLAADERLRSTSIIDERSAGFFALGLAKASGRPVALACTSGTAAANYAPAVHEAHEARVPLLVLTADRPPELRQIGAGQTIDQVKLYGTAAKWYFEVDAAPASAERMRWVRQLACRAYWTALDGRPGPVHLNFSFREPLVLDHPLEGAEPGGGGLDGGRPWVTRPRVHAAPAASVVEGLAAELKARPRAVLVAGRQERDPRLGPALAELAEGAKIPLLADPLSGARRGPAAIAHYDALLRDPDWAEEHAPELVIRVGDLPTSKPLRQWLHGLDGALQVTLDAENAWQDPGGAVGTILGGDPRATLEALGSHLARRTDPSWLERFRRADHAAAGAIAHVLGASGLSEPRVAAELGARLPEAATLFVASSMPIRDVETFFPARHAPPRVLSNRGANGIDGTVSSAFGVAAAARGPAVLLIGDVALAHDVGGLLANVRQRLKLTVVLLDNDGGGIFDFLPVRAAAAPDAYAEHIATPHGLDFSHAAALYGLAFECAADMDGFRDALQRALGADRSSIVHVQTSRPANVALHRDVWDHVARSVRDAA
jgi:2-succinyl-5-enolpyruvyl-6-hydroxy-3-cyclohexene-1-carboxylate synthase